MARWLADIAQWVGPGWTQGALYQVVDYPGFVPGGAGRVRGDLFVLTDAEAQLAQLDAYEECTSDHPQPHEYARQQCVVETPDGPVEAWVYLYALSITGHSVIAGGDFLAAGRV